MQHKSALLLLACLSGCTNPTPEQQAKLAEVLTVACNVDGVIVPLAQPIIATMGSAGAAASSVDLLVHPSVVAACQALKGVPAGVTAVAPVTVAGNSSATPAPSPTGPSPGNAAARGP
jgi:hypothetical protein